MFVVLCKGSEKGTVVSRRAAAVRRSVSCCSLKGVPHLTAGRGNQVLLRLPPSDRGSRAKHSAVQLLLARGTGTQLFRS